MNATIVPLDHPYNVNPLSLTHIPLFVPQRPKSAMEVETALAILEDRVALPFQRHFSRHIYVADIPRVDVVHPNAGGRYPHPTPVDRSIPCQQRGLSMPYRIDTMQYNTMQHVIP